MPSLRGMQPSFAAGELSPALWARTDLAKYQTGLRLAKNIFVHPHGGVSNRPGTLYLGETEDSSKTSRLIPFIYSTEQAYVLLFGDGVLRFIRDGEFVMDGDVPYEITTPYTSAMLPGLNVTQSADVLWICHPSVRPKELSRYADDDWELNDYAFKDGPFLDENVGDTTITPSGTLTKGGTCTLTASASTFASSDIGSLFRVSHRVEEQKVTATFTANGTTSALAVEGEWNFQTSGTWRATITLERSFDGGTSWMKFKTYVTDTTTDGNHDRGYVETVEGTTVRPVVSGWDGTDLTDPACTITITSAPRLNDGIVTLTAVSSATSATGTVQTAVANTSATKLWARGAWSPRQGWPRVPMFYQERLCFGGTDKEPNTIWFSETGDYNSFVVHTPQEDADAITAPIVSRMVNEIRGMIPLRDLIVLTSGSEWKISASSTGVFSYKEKQVDPQGYRGSASLEPLTVGNSILFVQEKGQAVRDLGYSLESDGYTGNNLSVLATHLFDGRRIVDWAWQQEPWSLVWCVLDNGALLTLTYMKEHEVWAWTRHETDGEFESVCSVPGDSRDEVYFVVKRTVDGSTVRYVETLAERFTDGDVKTSRFLDCAGVYEGDPTSSVTGLTWLEGKTVNVLADGGVVAGLVVQSGSVTLPNEASEIVVGLPFLSEMETLQIDFQTQDGTGQGRPKRIPEVVLRLHETRGVAAGPSSERPDLVVDLKPPFTTSDPIALFTGDAPIVLHNGFDRNGGRIYVRQEHPLPMTVLGVLPSVEFG